MALTLTCNDKNKFFTTDEKKKQKKTKKKKKKRFKFWSCQNICDALLYLLHNIFIRFCTKLHREKNCGDLVADLCLFCYRRDFMISFCDDKADITEAFN